jgi:tripartite-type tricarboxylate transporter receptor subunit TctC
MFKMMAGINIVHVPYRGTGPALTDLLGGQVQLFFGSLLASIEYVKAGRLRALAVTGPTRLEALPGILTLSEFVPGAEMSDWYGVFAPRNTPSEIVNQLNKEVNAVPADPNVVARIAEQGATVLPIAPDEFRRLIVEDTDKWAIGVKFSGAKAD